MENDMNEIEKAEAEFKIAMARDEVTPGEVREWYSCSRGMAIALLARAQGR